MTDHILCEMTDHWGVLNFKLLLNNVEIASKQCVRQVPQPLLAMLILAGTPAQPRNPRSLFFQGLIQYYT